MRLEERVARGEILDLRALKAEFRRLSLLLHPDTSGRPPESFVFLKEDFAKAEARLKEHVPAATPPRFETLELCRLLRLAHAKGLPSASLQNRPTHRTLLKRVTDFAGLHSADLGGSVQSYLDSASMASPAFTAGLNLFLDTMLIHEGGGVGAWRAIASYLQEVSPQGTLAPLISWINDSKPSAKITR